MIEHRDVADAGQLPAAVDSHAPAPKPRPKVAHPAGAGLPQKGLAVRAAVPLHLKAVLTYAEAAALGIAAERTLRRLVAIGRVKKAIIRTGRSVRFVRDRLIDELVGGEA